MNQKKILFGALLLALGGAAQAQNAAVERLIQFAASRPQLENARAIGTLCFPGNRLSARLQDDCNTLVGNAFGANPGSDTVVRRALAAITGDNVTIPIDRSGLGRTASLPMSVSSPGAGFAALMQADASMVSLNLAGDEGIGANWSMFVNARLDNNERERSGNEDGFDQDGQALTVGFDWRTSASTHLGAAVVYGKREMDYSNDSGALDTTDVALNLFAGWQGGNGFYVDSLLSLTRRDHDQLRRIAYGLGPTAVDQRFDSSFDAEERLLALTGGFQFSRGASTFDPYLRLELVDAESDGYTEVSRSPLANGGGWAMEVDALDENFTRGILGFRWQHAISGSNGVWVPFVDLSWISVSGVDADAATVRYAGDRSNVVNAARLNFLMEADEEDDSYGSAALGLSAQWANGWSGFASYRQNFSEDLFRQREYNLGVRAEF
jgi:outer membrane lipase/esterase